MEKQTDRPFLVLAQLAFTANEKELDCYHQKNRTTKGLRY